MRNSSPVWFWSVMAYILGVVGWDSPEKSHSRPSQWPAGGSFCGLGGCSVRACKSLGPFCEASVGSDESHHESKGYRRDLLFLCQWTSYILSHDALSIVVRCSLPWIDIEVHFVTPLESTRKLHTRRSSVSISCSTWQSNAVTIYGALFCCVLWELANKNTATFGFATLVGKD